MPSTTKLFTPLTLINTSLMTFALAYSYTELASATTGIPSISSMSDSLMSITSVNAIPTISNLLSGPLLILLIVSAAMSDDTTSSIFSLALS